MVHPGSEDKARAECLLVTTPMRHSRRRILFLLTILPPLAGAFTMGCDSGDPDDKSARMPLRVGDDLYIAPAGVSQARAGKVLPTKGSEDVSSLLGPVALGVEQPD